MKVKNLLKRLFFALAAIAALCAVTMNNFTARSAFKGERGFTVAIDAGHGGIDGGAKGSFYGSVERDINLRIAKELKRRFLSAGFSVVMTRSGEGGLYGAMSKGFKRRDMDARVKKIKSSSADVLVSVHLNKYSDENRRGAQVFFRNGSEPSRSLAVLVQSRFNDAINVSRKYAPLAGDYYILNETVIPAVICECGFLSNEEDERLLNTKEHVAIVAESIFLGVTDFFASA